MAKFNGRAQAEFLADLTQIGRNDLEIIYAKIQQGVSFADTMKTLNHYFGDKFDLYDTSTTFIQHIIYFIGEYLYPRKKIKIIA